LAEVLNIDLKLSEVNSDSTQARFFKGEAAYGLSEIFASFNSFYECKHMIKKAKGFMGINYAIIRFIINTQTKKVISFERI